MSWTQPEQPDDTYTHEFNIESLPEVELFGHQWIQQGTEIICTSCPFRHGSYIPHDYQLYGIDDKGKPMLRKINVSD